MTIITCRTQAELDDAIHRQASDANIRIDIVGSATVCAFDSATVCAYGSATVSAFGSATVCAFDSATVRAYGSATGVHAFDSATVHAFGSATVSAYGSATVSAYGSATVHAFDSATVHAFGSATVSAFGALVVVRVFSDNAKVTGPGTALRAPRLSTPTEWCTYHGVKQSRGVVTLYKAVDDEYRSRRGGIYTPGTKPRCDDWRDHPGCGNGFHFCAHPASALYYFRGATRFVACRVKLSEVVVIDPGGLSDKVKAPRVLSIAECDIDGELVA